MKNPKEVAKDLYTAYFWEIFDADADISNEPKLTNVVQKCAIIAAKAIYENTWKSKQVFWVEVIEELKAM
jgi:hypothetical protein